MALTCCEIIWLVSLLKDPGLNDLGPITLDCDNQETLYIATNPIFRLEPIILKWIVTM